jgi:transcriptional regulator with XRE-family HTH domain
MTLGSKFKKVRNDLGLSAEKMAKSLGINRGTLIHYENDDRFPGVNIVIDFMKKYKVDPGWFLFDNNSDSNANKPPVIQDIYPGIPDNPDIDEMFECLQVPVIYYYMLSHFQVLKKQYESYIKEHFDKKKEKENEGRTGQQK